MKTLGFVLLCLAWPSCVAAQTRSAEAFDAKTAITRAFDTHSIVLFGELHANKQEYEFLDALVSSSDFAEKVDDIVVEYGNSLYQETVDRYISGDDVPVADVQKAWQNTMALDPASPVYPSFYEAVRKSNLHRTGKRHLRILLGDPYINWNNVKSREDVGPYLAHRDEFYASVVKQEVLVKGHRALLIAGWGHFARPPLGPGFIEKQIRTAGATTFVVLLGTNAVGGYDDLDKRFDKWKLPSLIPLEDTWVGDLPAMSVLSGGTALPGPDPIKLKGVADALLYLGSRDTLTMLQMSQSALENSSYGREMKRRFEILFGQPPSPFPAQTEAPQFPRQPGPLPPLPPPPKSINDPLPPRPH